MNEATIKTVNVDDLDLDKIYQGDSPYSEKGIAKFKKYCKDNNIFYYAKTEDNFSMYEAVALAHDKKCTTVVYDMLG